MRGSHFLSAMAGLLLSACDPPKAAWPGPASTPSVDRARKLLTEAGFEFGRGFPRLEILYNSGDAANQRVSAAIQQMWWKNLGIEVALRNTEWKVYLDDLSKLRYDIARRGWIGDYLDPNTFVELFTSDNGNNNTGWGDPEYDALVDKAAAEPDPARRLEHLRKAEAILMRDVPIMPVFFYVSSNCWKEHVRGVHPNIQDTHPLTGVWAEGRETLVINNGQEVQTLDPGLARGGLEYRVLIGLFEGLTTPDPRTLAPLPGVAETWEISPDGKTYAFKLRECAWSDGRPVTAADFVYAWTRVLDPRTPTDYASQLYYVKGARAYREGATSDPASVGVRAVGDRTLVVELENPCTFFLDLCAFFTYYPVRRDAVEKHGADWTRPETIVTNGPFRLAERLPTNYLLLEKNPRYWNASAVRQPRIKFLAVTDGMAAWNLYKDGACDWITSIPLDLVDEIVKRPDYRGGTYLATQFYSFNVTRKPLDDRRVRLALCLAIDREAIVGKIMKRGQQPAHHLTPPAWPDYTSPRFDAEE